MNNITKQYIILVFLTVNATCLYGQSYDKSVKILVGENLDFIQSYFDNIKKEHFPTNQHVISSKTTEKGNLVLECSTPTIGGEEKANFIVIKTTFIRTDDGDEICVDQLIMGTQISAYSNLAPIKDTFMSKGAGVWEQEYNDAFVVSAEYQYKSDSDFYGLHIYLKKIN